MKQQALVVPAFQRLQQDCLSHRATWKAETEPWLQNKAAHPSFATQREKGALFIKLHPRSDFPLAPEPYQVAFYTPWEFDPKAVHWGMQEPALSAAQSGGWGLLIAHSSGEPHNARINPSAFL